MTVLFTTVVILDGWLDGSLTASAAVDKPILATILCILIAVLTIPAVLELSKLAAIKELKIFTPFAIAASILFATTWYWPQFVKIQPLLVTGGDQPGTYLFFLSGFALLGLLFIQYIRYGTSEVLANCGANYFSIIYVGLLGGFVLAVRIDFGLWPFLMFIFVVKAADIGAYTAGKLFGSHKFSPRLSPGKTWEGMAGAVAMAVIVAVLFAALFGIMKWWLAVVFGVVFAFIGQLGDLAESMIKRDARQKDSTNAIPGFGGILDVIDSPLVSGVFAYLFFIYA